MATTQTWLGGGNNKASNPNDWSPSGTPKPGETLNIEQGTINVHAGDLSGDTLVVTDVYPNSPTVTINAFNNSVLSLETGGYTNGGPPSAVKLNAHGSVFLNIPETFNSNITASGGTLTFIGGSNTFFGNKQVFNEPLYGNSNLILTSATHSSEHMEVGGYVGSGLNFDITGNGPPFTSLQIDHPSQFHGSLTVNLPTYGGYNLGYIAFMGLHATSVDLKGDMLEMFNGTKLVDSVTYFGSQTGIQFEQNSAGIMMSTSFGPYQAPGGTGTIIPFHVGNGGCQCRRSRAPLR